MLWRSNNYRKIKIRNS